jgi:hypothetical protein
MQVVAAHKFFEMYVVAAVLANTVVLAMVYYGMSDAYEARLELANNVLTLCFVVEAVIKLLAMGRSYFLEPFNVFDFLVTLASVAGVFINAASAVSALRALRILRLLRLLTVLKELQRFLVVFVRAIAMSFSFIILFVFVVFLFALLGMQLFGGAWGLEVGDEYAPQEDRYSFNTFGDAMMASFFSILGAIDSTIFIAMARTSGAAALYHVAQSIVGNFVVINLMIAILFSLFSDENAKLLEGPDAQSIPERLTAVKSSRLTGLPASTQEVHTPKLMQSSSMRSVRPSLKKNSIAAKKNRKDTFARQLLSPGVRTANYIKEVFTDAEKWKNVVPAPLEVDFEGKSLYLFSPTNPIRRFAFSIVDDRRFEAFTFLVIIFNCGVLALQTPGVSAEAVGWNGFMGYNIDMHLCSSLS